MKHWPGKIPYWWMITTHQKYHTYVTGFVKIDPNHTGTEIHFIAEH